MCGRYYINAGIDAEELREIMDAVNRRSRGDGVKTAGEVFPTDTVPVIARSRALAPSAFAMAWGYTLPDGRRVINARSESAEEKPLFRDGMRQRRCAIPASCYFEWERAGKDKAKYAIRPAGRGLMYMAGIYRLANGRAEFAILTRDPAEDIAFIHNRMPVLLPAERVAAWLDPRSSASELLKSAILQVGYERVGAGAAEQIGMEL